MGFRQFSHRLTEIQIALANGDVPAARLELAQWKAGVEEASSPADIDADEVVRRSCEHGLQLAHKHVFGVFFWFVLLPGPIGPILFRLSNTWRDAGTGRRTARCPLTVLASSRAARSPGSTGCQRGSPRSALHRRDFEAHLLLAKVTRPPAVVDAMPHRIRVRSSLRPPAARSGAACWRVLSRAAISTNRARRRRSDRARCRHAECCDRSRLACAAALAGAAAADFPAARLT